MKINILGSEWEIINLKKEEDKAFETCDGYCNYTIRKIVVCDVDPEEWPEEEKIVHMKRVTRHEIVHAFLFESGLAWCSSPSDSWAMHEEMVDWIAFQGPKLHKAWKDAKAL